MEDMQNMQVTYITQESDINCSFEPVDFHAHVLPSADHGSDGIEMSLSQLRLAYENGFNRVVATPHFYPNQHNVEEFLSMRDAAYDELLCGIGNQDGFPSLRLGTEILVCEGISRLPMLDRFCIRGTKTLLFELPFSDFSLNYVDDVRNLISDGYEIVLAHANRYVRKNVNLMIEAGAKIQLNAESLSGLFVSKKIKEWLNGGYVAALGSDIHMVDTRIYKKLKCAFNRIRKYDTVFSESERIWSEASV